MKSKWVIVNLQFGKCILLFFTFYFSLFTSTAQNITAIIDRDKIVIGEQIQLKVKAEDVDLVSGAIVKDLHFPDTINHLEILSHTIDTVTTSGTATYVHHLVLTSFDSGYWQFPSFELILAGNKKLATQPLNITVLPADVSNLQGYHDIKDILEVPLANNWWIIAALVGLGLICLFAVLWFVQKRTAPVTKKMSRGTLAEMYAGVMQHLEEQQNKAAADKEVVRKMYGELTATVRSFCDVLWMKRTTYLTTGEYMAEVKGKFFTVEEQTKYFQFLRLADAVKFAKYLPPVEETKEAISTLKDHVTTQYHHNKPISS